MEWYWMLLIAWTIVFLALFFGAVLTISGKKFDDNHISREK